MTFCICPWRPKKDTPNSIYLMSGTRSQYHAIKSLNGKNDNKDQDLHTLEPFSFSKTLISTDWWEKNFIVWNNAITWYMYITIQNLTKFQTYYQNFYYEHALEIYQWPKDQSCFSILACKLDRKIQVVR